jgi:DnaK suppressor protein
MNIEALISANTPASDNQARRFSATPPTMDDLSLGDWRPGTKPDDKRPPKRLDAFARSQKEKLLQLRAAFVNSLNVVAQDLRVESSDSSAFATHTGDAGSDACDRDYALSLLAKERNALAEVDEALQRIERGSYGICEMSGQPIPVSRLEAIPFVRFTVECQSELEKRKKAFPSQQSLQTLFAVADEEETEEPEENLPVEGGADTI